MKRILRIYWKENLLVGLFLLGEAIAQTVASLQIAHVFNAIIALDTRAFAITTSYVLAAFSVFLILIFFRIRWTARVVQKMVNHLRKDIVHRLTTVNYQTFHKETVGTYASWLTNDSNTIEKSFSSFYQIASGLIATVVSFLALFSFHWSLVLLTLLESIGMLLLPKLFEKEIKQRFITVSKRSETFLSQVTNYLSGFDTLYVFHRLPFIQQKVENAIEPLAASKIKQGDTNAKVATTGGIGNVLGQVSILALTGWLVLRKALAPGAVAATGNLASTIFNTLGNLNSYISEIQGAAPLFQHYLALDPVNETPVADYQPTGGIKMENIDYRYLPDKPLFQGLSFDFEPNKKYAIVGASGSGKSTLLNILNGKIRDYEGSIMLGNTELSQLAAGQIYQDVLYIDQAPYIFTGTIRENLMLDETFSDEELYHALEEADLLDMVRSQKDGLDQFVGENGRLLSGGQKQRLALARGFLRKKKIFLVDEGTANLDQTSAEKIEQLLLDKAELTVLMITHHLSPTIAAQLDGVLHLQDAAKIPA